MRILIYTETLEKENLKKDFNYLENNLHLKIDFFNNYDDAEYCMDIRQYDIVYIEYNKNHDKSYYNIMKYINKKELPPKVFLLIKENQKNNIINEFTSRIKNLEIIDINKINFKNHIKSINDFKENIIKKDNLILNIKDKTIFFEKDNELIEIEFSKKFDFYVLLYFIRHYNSTININSLLDATCEEPEFTKDSIIESSISSIRKSFKELFDINPIKAFKKVGYRFSILD